VHGPCAATSRVENSGQVLSCPRPLKCRKMLCHYPRWLHFRFRCRCSAVGHAGATLPPAGEVKNLFIFVTPFGKISWSVWQAFLVNETLAYSNRALGLIW
jgi:hypothetical protein